MPRTHTLTLAFALTLTAVFPAVAQEGSALSPRVVNEAAVPAVMAKAVDDFIIPGYRNLTEKTAAATKATAKLCAAPSQATADGARTAFSEVVGAWSAIEVVRLGPALEQNRFERFLFYPDRKSTGLKQVQAIVSKKDESAADEARLKGKSVAAQGLGALEYVLYGTGAETLLNKDGDFRCRYGLAITKNLDTIANEFLAAWQKPDGIQAAWKDPGPDNPEFRNNREAATELLGILVHGVETVKDQRLKPFYEGKDDKGRRALVVLILVVILRLEAQAELDRRVHEGADRVEGDHHRFGRVAEVERDREPLVGDDQVVEPVLDHDRHLVGIAVAQPVGHLDAVLARVEGDEEVVLARQTVVGDALKHVRDQPLHRQGALDGRGIGFGKQQADQAAPQVGTPAFQEGVHGADLDRVHHLQGVRLPPPRDDRGDVVARGRHVRRRQDAEQLDGGRVDPDLLPRLAQRRTDLVHVLGVDLPAGEGDLPRMGTQRRRALGEDDLLAVAELPDVPTGSGPEGEEHRGPARGVRRRGEALEPLGQVRVEGRSHRAQPLRHPVGPGHRAHAAVTGPGLTSFAAFSGSVSPTPYEGHSRATGQAPQAGRRA